MRCRRLSAYAPLLLKFSNFERLPGAQSTDRHDKVLRPGMEGRIPCGPPAAARARSYCCRTAFGHAQLPKSRPDLSGNGRSQRGYQARDPSRRRNLSRGCETRLSPASSQRSPGPSRRRPLHIVARFCAQRRQRSQGSRGGRRRLLRWRRSCACPGSRTVRLLPGKCHI